MYKRHAEWRQGPSLKLVTWLLFGWAGIFAVGLLVPH
jgi:hypothetical protein